MKLGVELPPVSGITIFGNWSPSFSRLRQLVAPSSRIEVQQRTQSQSTQDLRQPHQSLVLWPNPLLKVAIYAALGAKMAIAKFVGASVSGSSAMLSEGIHSVVDSVNEVLLLYGLKQSEQGPGELHPLGHRQELYFRSLVVAGLMFLVRALWVSA